MKKNLTVDNIAGKYTIMAINEDNLRNEAIYSEEKHSKLAWDK